MNGKVILLLFICLNIVTMVFSFSCAEAGVSCHNVGSPMLEWAFSIDSDTSLNATGGVGLDDTFQSQSGSMYQAQSPGAQETSTISLGLDYLKMILGFVSMLTPIPILTFIWALSLPLWLAIILAAPATILYVISIAEFIGGRQF